MKTTNEIPVIEYGALEKEVIGKFGTIDSRGEHSTNFKTGELILHNTLEEATKYAKTNHMNAITEWE